uniref:Uncharacterized protein n=1 Tax=Romanomermis culicivorax TaxID=13658 RepID=A0A915IRK6_ROMCU
MGPKDDDQDQKRHADAQPYGPDMSDKFEIQLRGQLYFAVRRCTVPYGTTFSCYTSPHAPYSTAPCGAVRRLMSGCYTSCRTVTNDNK